ncbi:MAG: helix-turn-helix domain-containing protein [Prevotella sp.]|nr:helix-turn-helix domain-containing protein [Prevotella sp.]
MNEVIPYRLKTARQSQGLSMDKLVSKMGGIVSKMYISEIERGVYNPSQEALAAIAQVCGVPVSYFYKQDYADSGFCFRTKNGTSSQHEQIKAKLKIEIERYLEQEETFVIERTEFVNPLKDFPVSSYDDADEAAVMLRKCWEIGSQPIHSVYELLQEKGVVVIEIPIDCKELDGTSTIVNNEVPVIIINSEKNVTNERKRFTALHELGHLMLDFTQLPKDAEPIMVEHPFGDVTFKTPDDERLCNHFADAMLIQKESIRRRLGNSRKDLTLPELISIKNMYGISIASLVHRAHDLAIISDRIYDKWYDDMIKPNYMEKGWGCYPINEVADRQELLAERMKIENIANYDRL